MPRAPVLELELGLVPALVPLLAQLPERLALGLPLVILILALLTLLWIRLKELLLLLPLVVAVVLDFVAEVIPLDLNDVKTLWEMAMIMARVMTL